jgi:iron complex transport system substrate-binding protein
MQQEACARASKSQTLVRSVTAWLLARGQRSIDLRSGGSILAQGTIAPEDLDTADVGGDGVAAASKVVTLAPSNAELVDALGVFDRVIATEDSSDHPPEIRFLPKLGPDLAPDLDRLASFEPALVLSSLTVPGMERNVVGLEARAIPQIVLAPRSLDDVMADVRRVGAAMGVAATADAVVANMRDERRALERRRQGPPVRVYLEWWPRPMFTPGADCYSNELIALAGGVNVFADRPGASVEISAAELLEASPEVCFVSWCGVPADKLDPARLRRRDGLEALEAASCGRVYPLDERFSGRPGPRMLEAARRMEVAIRRARAGD